MHRRGYPKGQELAPLYGTGHHKTLPMLFLYVVRRIEASHWQRIFDMLQLIAQFGRRRLHCRQ